jgi:tripartite-type tricarboxylate transporter receptor subunit TctC
VQESGVANFQAVAWFGLQAPARTPRPALDRLTAACMEICAEPATISRIREVGSAVTPLDGPAFDRFIAAENDKWREVVRVANIRLE